MAIAPPGQINWWKEPIEKVEVAWVAIAFLWGLVMFGTMVVWHFTGKQNLSNEAYRITPDAYAAKTEEMVKKYKVRDEGTTGIPVVHPPAGSDVYLLARLWQWYPVLELEKGKSYRLHLSSIDYMHGFSLQPTNINIQVLPGYEMVITTTPPESGEFTVVCNEFCGIGHHTMVGKIHVVDKR
ncbi:MAG: cytochrome C oxidase subunit II [Rhodospirillaceae bacterium]